MRRACGRMSNRSLDHLEMRRRAEQESRMPLVLRSARREDAQLLFKWVNSPESIAAKLTTHEPIPWEVHESWLTARLGDPGTGLWIAERERKPVGQVRVQEAGGHLEVDIFVAAEERRKGLARRMLAALAAECEMRWHGWPLVARTRHDNIASQRLFSAAGYSLQERKEDHLVYVLRGP